MQVGNPGRPRLKRYFTAMACHIALPEPDVLPLILRRSLSFNCRKALSPAATVLHPLIGMENNCRNGRRISRKLSYVINLLHHLVMRQSEFRTVAQSWRQWRDLSVSRTVALSRASLAALRHFILLSRTVSICRDPPKPFLTCDFVELDHLSRTVATFWLVLCHHDAEEIFHRSLK